MTCFANKTDFIESVKMKGLTISLIASGDQTEIIHHQLEPDTRWALEPEAGWSALEYLFIVNGQLKLQMEDGSFKAYKTGDSFYRLPITEHYVFQSIGPTEFIYVTSQPIFHRYSNVSRQLVKLAVSIEEKDGYTGDHCARIANLAMQVGEEIGLNSNDLLQLNMASFFHDVGKIIIPLNILQKPGKLTTDEWDIMKKHTIYGRMVLEETKLPLLVNAGKIVEQHHERYDGRGYPYGLSKDEIDIKASIISVVDAYDAITSNRPYQKARTKEEAVHELKKNKGSFYHPDIVDVFAHLQT